MEFNESYFAGESREDFYVRPMIKRAWAVQLDILCEIDAICKRHNISYYAEYGTLLGAVRHKGYIPWDDDLDIGMLRDDYERFLQYAPNELSGGLEVITPYNEMQYKELMARVITGRRINPDPAYLKSHHGCPYVLGVDIFPQDFIPRDKQKEEIQLELLVAANSLAQTWDMEGVSEKDKWECLNQIIEMCGIKINNNIPIEQQLYQLSDSICAMYHREEADEVTQMDRMTMDRNWRLPLQCYESTIEMPFENITIPVPIGYEQALKLRYGENYMTPVRQWGTHSYPIFKEQEEILKQAYKNMNKEVPQYFAE